MIKVQPIVRDLVLCEIEAYYALAHGFMNMSSYAHRIRPQVEKYTKKKVTINSLVVALSRIRTELKKEKPLLQDVEITNITTKLPLTEIIFENTRTAVERLESFHKKVRVSRENFFTTTVNTAELNLVCSHDMESSVLKHFGGKPKFIARNLAAVGISFDAKHFHIPNTLFSLMSVVARARINIAEVVSSYTELTFIVAEKDFSNTVTLFSELHKKHSESDKTFL